MKTALAAVVALLSGGFLCRHFRHRKTGDPRLASPGALGGAILILLASTMVALARPSPYPAATPFSGDRYGAAAQLDVVKAVRIRRAGGPRYLYPTRRRPPERRQRWRHDIAQGPRHLTSGRPAAWCGWWLGHHLGMPLRKLWLARNWADVGSPANPGPGVIVVWRHHVGIITGRHGNQWLVKSGNDGRRVRERPRSLARAIAFRHPPQRSSS
jgi:hypothetical protein